MTDDDLDTFIALRPRLFDISYRIVGDVHEAEDLVQKAWLRWHRTDRAAVLNPEAFLRTATTRLAINHIQSAHHRRETTAAALQHDDAADHAAGPESETERYEEIELAVHLLLERLPPPERAVFVLREGFEYPYSQIAQTLQITPANARQLGKRARARALATKSYPYGAAAGSRLLGAFGSAARGGDLTRLEAVLAADLTRSTHRSP